MRLNANGSLDTGFDLDGSRIIDLGGTKQGIVLGLALDHQGRIVLGGNVKDGTDVKGLLVRLTSAGAHDTAFSTDGVVEEEFGGADEFNHVAVDDRGRVVVAGNGGTNGAHATSGTDAIAARYTDAGALDTTFGASGKRHVDFGGASDDAEDMALDPFGRVVIAGDDGGTDYAVGRLTADGTVDTSFDSDGVAKIDFGGASEDGQAVAIQMDGRILAVGRTGDDFAVARLSGGGTRNYAVQDANFNTTAVTDATGKVLERYQYDPYGAVTVLNADFSLDADAKQDVHLPYLWQGGALVTATGVYHFRNRDVDPRLGRATQADPLGYPEGSNRYQWEQSSPIGRRDPLGLETSDELVYQAGVHYSLTLGDPVLGGTFGVGIGAGYETDYFMPVVDLGLRLRLGNGHGSPADGGYYISVYAAFTAVAGYHRGDGDPMPIHLFDYDYISQIDNPYEYSVLFGQSFVFDSAVMHTTPVGYVGVRTEDVSAYMANDNALFTLLTNWMTEEPPTDSGNTGSGGVDFSLDGGGTVGLYHSTFTGEAPNRNAQNREPEWTSQYYRQLLEHLALNHTITGMRYTPSSGEFFELGFSGDPTFQNLIHDNYPFFDPDDVRLHRFEHDPDRYGPYFRSGSD